MRARSPKIPQEIWWYVGGLTVVVILLWQFFWSKEFKLTTINDESNSLGNIFKSFTNSLDSGAEVLSKISQGLKEQPLVSLPPTLVEQLVSKVNEQLWQQRVAGWPVWSNEKISFQLPPAWQWQQQESKYIIGSFDESLSLYPAARAKVEINLLENPDNLTVQAWQADWQVEHPAYQTASSSQEIISNFKGVKLTYTEQQGEVIKYTEIIFVPKETRMIELFVARWGNGTLGQIVADFKKTIKFY